MERVEMENNQERDFKGVFIPKEIWLNNKLTMLEKNVFAEIDSLDNGAQGCFASNEYLAKFCQCSVSSISRAISKLIELKYLNVISFNGRQRCLKSNFSWQGCISNLTMQDMKIDKHINIVHYKEKDNTNVLSKEKELIGKYFNETRKLYPRKEDPIQAKETYEHKFVGLCEKEIIEKAEKIKAVLENHIAIWQENAQERKYTKLFSTWLNANIPDSPHYKRKRSKK